MRVFPRRFAGLFLLIGAGFLCSEALQTPTYAPVGTLPAINVGGNYMEAQFARLDFAQKLLEEQREQARKAAEAQKLVKSGTVSVLDLQAPAGAIREFNSAANLLKQQKSKEAIVHLEKAIKKYPKFLSAYQNLGLAYENLGDNERARSEFEIAIKLDPAFAPPFAHLGRLELSQENVEAAETNFEKAVSLQPRDAAILTLLCYTQYRTHQYHHVFDTAARVHSLEHKGMANVHYIAASSAIALREYANAKRELQLFTEEDPSNPLAPSARQNLEILAGNNTSQPPSGSATPHAVASQQTQTFPDSEYLRKQLASLDEDSADETCSDCGGRTAAGASTAPVAAVLNEPADGFRLRKSVDEVVVSFAVTRHGHDVTDLQANDLKILDSDKPPEKVLQFTTQSKLPLHLGLLIDASGSVKERFSFEKHAAAKFVDKVLINTADLAFVAGFSNSPNVTQDFTANHDDLATGIEKLQNNGGTALFDAISFACWKLAAYPERERVANVLVVLTDGEDNSSRSTLKQAIRDAENTGVAIYVISTKNHEGLKTDADKVLVQIGERSGGEAMFPGGLSMLGHSFEKLRDSIRSRYLVAYKPADFTPDGTYRRITILVEKNGHRFQVHARKGYYARLSPNNSSHQPQYVR